MQILMKDGIQLMLLLPLFLMKKYYQEKSLIMIELFILKRINLFSLMNNSCREKKKL